MECASHETRRRPNSMYKHSGQSNGVNGQMYNYISSALKHSIYTRRFVYTTGTRTAMLELCRWAGGSHPLCFQASRSAGHWNCPPNWWSGDPAGRYCPCAGFRRVGLTLSRSNSKVPNQSRKGCAGNEKLASSWAHRQPPIRRRGQGSPDQRRRFWAGPKVAACLLRSRTPSNGVGQEG